MSDGLDQRAFMIAGGQTVDAINIEQFERYLAHIEEEVAELRRDYEAGNIVKTLDALTDIRVVCNGATWSLGINPDHAWDVVNASNRSKIGPYGDVYRREDGQIAKGPHFVPPEPGLAELLIRAGHDVEAA